MLNNCLSFISVNQLETCDILIFIFLQIFYPRCVTHKQKDCNNVWATQRSFTYVKQIMRLVHKWGVVSYKKQIVCSRNWSLSLCAAYCFCIIKPSVLFETKEWDIKPASNMPLCIVFLASGASYIKHEVPWTAFIWSLSGQWNVCVARMRSCFISVQFYFHVD